MLKRASIFVLFVLLVGSAWAEPNITNLAVTATTSNSATVQWTTDEAASTQLVYGVGSLINSTPLVPALVTSHTVTVSGLYSGVTWSYAAISVDSAGNKTQSGTQQFALCSGNGSVPLSGTTNNYYEYGLYTITWVNLSGQSISPTICGQALTTPIGGTLDGTSSFSINIPSTLEIVPSPSGWSITQTGINGTIGSFTASFNTSGVANNISSTLLAAAEALGNNQLIHVWCTLDGLTCYPQAGNGGVTSLNTLTGAVTLAAGMNITLSTVGNTITITSTGGGGGGGPLGTLVNDLVTNNASNTAAQDIYNFIATPSYTPATAITAAVSNNGIVTLMPGSGAGFTNTNNTVGVKVVDDQNLGAGLRSATEFGAYCDGRGVGVSLNSGSTTVTIYDDYFYTADIGKVLTLVATVGGVPTAFEPKITAIGGSPSSSTATIDTVSPATFAAVTQGGLGHDDTAALTAAMAAAAQAQHTGASTFTGLLIPGGNCVTHTLTYNGISMAGLNGQISQLSGYPGEDLFAEPDPATGVTGEGNNVHIHDMGWNIDDRIDATQPWQIINSSGTTAKAAVYRPVGINAVTSNNPLAPGWIQGPGRNYSGAINGVAITTAGSPVICVTSGPSVGEKIFFPYLNPIFTTTVLSGAGSCGSGSPITLAANMPAGSSGSQTEWFAGTSPQTISANISSGACPATITLTNSILPSPASESNVAPYGMIKIDSEEFTYFGKTNAYSGGVSTNYLTITGCAQNGTARAAHSAGATVFPMNQFKPSYPYPVFPTATSGSTTPSVAAMYPSWNIGNAAFAAPNSNGNLGTIGAGSFANALIENIFISASLPINNTTGIYLVGLPYSSTFRNITIAGPEYGIEEGTPSLNTGGAWASAQPTADGTHWDSIRINTCNILDLISGGQNEFSNWNVYSNCYVGGTYVGANSGLYFTQAWSDETGYPQAIQGDVDLHNMYQEGEFGSQYGAIPGYEFDISKANWDNLHMGSGGETYLGGNNQHFIGGNFNNQIPLPVINYGPENGSDYTQLLYNDGLLSNTYGGSSLINYAPNAAFSSALGNTGGSASAYPPFGATQLGNSRESWHGQSNETWNLGNTSPSFVNSNGGYIPAAEFNTSTAWENAPFQVAWAYDATTLPDGTPAGGSVGCQIPTATQGCFSYRWNLGGAIFVGPGQRISAGKYTMYIASKSSGAATSYQLAVGVCGPGDTANLTVPVTSSYSIYTAQVDFTGKGSCGGSVGLGFGYASPAADTVYVAYVDFAPVAQQPTSYNLNVLNQVLLNGSAGTLGQCFISGGSSTSDYYGTCTSNFQVNGTALISSSTINFVAGSGITITNPSAGQITISSSGGSFATLAGGTNTSAAMLVGTGASLGASGTGTITATSAPFAGIAAGTNLNALLIGTGGSLGTTGSGTITATSVPFSGVAAGTNAHALVIGTGGSLGVSGSGTIAATTAGALATTPSTCSAGSAPTGITTSGNATGCTAYLTGSLTSGDIPVATGASTLVNSLLSDNGTTLGYSGSGGFALTGVTTPAAMSLAAGTGSIPALLSNSAGFAAPTSGGTSYLLKLPATITQGFLLAGTPATGDGVNESAVTTQHLEFVIGAAGNYNFFTGPVVVAQAVALNNAHFVKLAVTNGAGGSCATPPTFNVFDTASHTGTAVTGSATQQAFGTATSASETLSITAGDTYGIYMSSNGSSCTGGFYSIYATIEEP